MENKKYKSYDKLVEENNELKTVMRKLSHEMGNALTLLGSSIYYLENDISGGVSNCDITNLKNDYLYICNLFKNLREYNHAEGLSKKEISLTCIINDIEVYMSKLADRDSVRLVFEKNVDTDSIKIFADMTKIRQVLINILKNSIEAMADNDTQKGKKIVVGTSLSDDTVHMEIRDNGKGISEKYIKEIFQPMFTYDKEEGTGLGLAVVKKIVEDHQGKVKAVSTKGVGTAIHIYFSVVKEAMKNQTTGLTCEVS